MDPSLYKAIMEDDFNQVRGYKDVLMQLTPNKNTALHMAAQYVSRGVNETMSITIVNSKGETPLHIAAREGNYRVVKALIDGPKAIQGEVESFAGVVKEMLRMTNKKKNTPLHEAMKTNSPILVSLLLTEDPEYSYEANAAGETPLYLAAERGFEDVVVEILKTCKVPLLDKGPDCRTALHAAVLSNTQGTTTRILERLPALIKVGDQRGWTPLHWAAHFNFMWRVRQLLNFDRSVAYIKDNEGMAAIHVAASIGAISAIKEIISRCPDCDELVDNKGRNVLHMAIHCRQKEAAECILKHCPSSNLINEEDEDGNTPLHMLASTCQHIPALIKHPKLDMKVLNKQNLTALDIIPPYTFKRFATTEITIWQEKPTKEDISEIHKATSSHLIVATLIATVTFAAGFTLPGGFNGNEGPDQGMAILTKKAAFHAFVIFDTIANLLSLSAVFLYFIMAINYAPERLFYYFAYAALLTMFSVAAMVVAFVTGTYAVLSHSLGLAIAICVIGCCFFIPYFYHAGKLFK
ncbi:LOW QUALITY PROTEIN: PGG domain [Dillenia turbinata]|uniref:PGG domain n=1 Tax=Dillenia turbinata TaxID=194707 RepID=A0AAN8ZCG4_9MAGN